MATETSGVLNVVPEWFRGRELASIQDKIVRLLRAGVSISGPPKARLVIFEHGNTAFLKALGLEGEKYALLTSGYNHFYFGAGVLVRFFWNLLKRRRFTSKDVGVAYLSACLRHVGARAVLTFIDNAILFYYLAAECQDIGFVVVQNGMRSELDPDFNSDSFVSPATYFCFGDYDVSLRARSTLRTAVTTPVGSVLDSYHQSTSQLGAQTEAYDVCLVSQFRVAPNRGAADAIAESLRALVGYLKLVCQECGVTLCVAGGSVDDEREKSFYESAFGRTVPFVFRRNFSTYEMMGRSQVVVGVSSTCLFEAFARGRKILFYASFGDGMVPLPPSGIWLLQGAHISYVEFKARLLSLLAMNGDEFSERSRSAASYFMHYDVHRPAHEVVKAHLRNAL